MDAWDKITITGKIRKGEISSAGISGGLPSGGMFWIHGAANIALLITHL